MKKEETAVQAVEAVKAVETTKMVSFKERIMKVSAVGAKVTADGKVETVTAEFEFEGHRNDGRVQRMVDAELKDKDYRLTVSNIERTERTYNMPVEAFKKVAKISK